MANPFPFSSGDVLTAAELNSIGDWSDFTPNIRAGTGSFTSVATYVAKYCQVNDLAVVTLRFKITNVGSASGSVLFDLPLSWADWASGTTSDSGIGYGRENHTTGKMTMVFANSTTQALIGYYDNSSMIATGAGTGVTCIYRTS